MAQNKIKGITKKQKTARQSSTASSPKKGQRYCAPKNAKAIKVAALRKGLSAKIGRSIEQHTATAASSGKLTIMKNVAMENAKTSSSTAHQKNTSSTKKS